MEIPLHLAGLTRQIVEEAIRRTKEAREYIINEVLTPCIAEPRTPCPISLRPGPLDGFVSPTE